MNKAANIILCGLLVLLLINGLRLTFFPLNACRLVRDNQMPTIEESIMEFHAEQAERLGIAEGETE